jgi:hypothetical protein
LWDRDEKPTSSLQLNRQWGRLDLDTSFPPANLKRHSGLQASFLPDCLGNDHTPNSINGSFHGRNFAIFYG